MADLTVEHLKQRVWKCCSFIGESDIDALIAAVRAEEQAKAEAEIQRLREAQGWQLIDDSHKGGKPMLIALIRDGKVWRVSDAAHNGLGWYTLNGGVACHWATHAMPLPAPPLGVPRG